MGEVAKQMEGKIQKLFSPQYLEIMDDSHRHAGHAGTRAQGESHFTVLIVSESFRGMSRVERHRKVYEALQEELDAGLHALAIRALSPEEYACAGA